MAETAFELAVLIETVDRFTSPMKNIMGTMSSAEGRLKTMQAAMKNMGSSAAEIDKVTESMKKLERSEQFDRLALDMAKIGKSKDEIAAVARSFEELAAQSDKLEKISTFSEKFQKTALVGGGITLAGAGIATGLVEATKQAGEFQTQLVTIQDVTGATNAQIKSLGDAIMNTSTQVTKFNDMDLTGFAKQLATGGFNNVTDVQKLLLPVSQFAEAQAYEGKSASASESVNQAIQMAHMFKQYSPKQFSGFLNQFNKYSNMEPGDSSELYQTLTYLAPVASREFKMNTSDVMSLAAVANRVGLTGSHGGTNAADMILRLIPGLIGGKPTVDKNGKVKTPKAWKAMENLGLVDANGNSPFFKNGHITNLSSMLQILVNASKRLTPEQMAQDYKDIFGIQGGRAAAILSDPTTIEQLSKMQGQLGKTKSMQQIQGDINKTPEGQLNMLKSNAMTAELRFAQALGPMMNPILQNLNRMLSNFLKLEEQHPKLMKLVGVFAIMTAGLLLTAGPLTSIIGLFGMLGAGIARVMVLSKFGLMAKEMKALVSLGPAFVESYGMIGGTLRMAWMGLATFGSWIMRVTGLQKVWTAVTAAFDAVMDANPIVLIILAIIALVAAIILVITHWKQVIKVLKEVWAWMKKFAGDVGRIFTKMWHDAVDWGSNIIKGLWQGMKNFGGWLASNVRNFVSQHITGPFKSFLGIHSPSTVFAENGMYIVQGLALGIQRYGSLAQKAAMGLATGVNSSAQVAMAGSSIAGAGGQTIVQVYPHKHQNADEIADAVIRKLGRSKQRSNLRTGARPNPSAR